MDSRFSFLLAATIILIGGFVTAVFATRWVSSVIIGAEAVVFGYWAIDKRRRKRRRVPSDENRPNECQARGGARANCVPLARGGGA